MWQRTFLLLICALTLSDCGQQYSGRYGGGYQTGGFGPTSLGPNTGAPGGTRHSVAILLPLTGPRADLAPVLLQSAQLALQDNSGPPLDVLDTAGTAAGAAVRAQAP